MTPVKGRRYCTDEEGWLGWEIEALSEPEFFAGRGVGVHMLATRKGHPPTRCVCLDNIWPSLREIAKPQPSIAYVEVGDTLRGSASSLVVTGVNMATEEVAYCCGGSTTWVPLAELYSLGFYHESSTPPPVAAYYTRSCSCDGHTLFIAGCQCGATANCSCTAFDRLHFGCRCAGSGGVIRKPEPERKPDLWR